MQNHSQSPGKKADPFQEQLSCEITESSEQTLNNFKMILNGTKKIILFFSPYYFWMIFLCYIFMFLNGFLSSSMLDTTVIETQILVGKIQYNYNITITICLATICSLIAIIRLVGFLKLKSHKLSFFTALHITLFLMFAEKFSSFGETFLWAVFR